MATVDYDAWHALTVKRAVCQLGNVNLKINIIFTSISETLSERACTYHWDFLSKIITLPASLEAHKADPGTVIHSMYHYATRTLILPRIATPIRYRYLGKIQILLPVMRIPTLRYPC